MMLKKQYAGVASLCMLFSAEISYVCSNDPTYLDKKSLTNSEDPDHT